MMLSTRDQVAIETAALRQFDCANLPFGHHRETRERIKKRGHVTATTAAFFKVMNGNNPPATKDAAVRSTVGALGMLFSFLFPQFALAISVASWLWDYMHGAT
jgi:hypothetical protein